jgi:Coenzyme PQQ synthesis protein D (PqqD)
MRYTISPDAAFAAVEDGAVVLHMRTKRYYSLNETGTFVWRRVEDGLDDTDIAARIVGEYDVGTGEAEVTVAGLLGELVEESLICKAES